MKSGLTIGVDLGGTNLRIAAYAPNAGILRSIGLPTRVEAGPHAVLDDMCAAIHELHEEYGEDRELVGIGVGSPGPLELPTGRLHRPPNLPGWDGFNLRHEIETRLQQPILLENDANLTALAEYELGLGRELGIDSLCMITLGTGVGNGIILNGRVWHGATGMGGEAGHASIDPQGLLCACGNTGCLEMYASATALVRSAEILIASGNAPGLTQLKQRQTSLTAYDLANAARQRDPDAREIFQSAGRALGISLASLINILNLPLYVIGGGVASSWDLLSQCVFEELRRRSYVYALTAAGEPASHGMAGEGTLVLPARLGEETGLLGACIFPLQQTANRKENSRSQ